MSVSNMAEVEPSTDCKTRISPTLVIYGPTGNCSSTKAGEDVEGNLMDWDFCSAINCLDTQLCASASCLEKWKRRYKKPVGGWKHCQLRTRSKHGDWRLNGSGESTSLVSGFD